MSDRTQGILAWLLAVGIIAVAVFVYMLFHNHATGKTTEQCQAQFGSDWTGQVSRYDPNFCINSKGEVRYPR